MRKLIRILWVVLVLSAVIVASVGVGLGYWVGQADFRERVEQQASKALGVPTRLKAITVDWLPVPSISLQGLEVRTQPALTAGEVQARPEWLALLHGEFRLATLVVRDAVVPQQSVDALIKAAQRGPSEQATGQVRSGDAAAAVLALPRHTVIDQLTWISGKGVASTIDGKALLSGDGLPETASVLVRKGPWQGAKVEIKRAGLTWQVQMAMGGGTVQGALTLPSAPVRGQPVEVRGQFATTGVEVSALTAPSRVLTGKLQASTTLSGRATTPGGLAEALQSNTTFEVQQARLEGIDLLKAVGTLGLSRGGVTSLDRLSGRVSTSGRSARLTDLVAQSSLLTARGHVAVSPSQALSGRVTVDVVNRVTGVPLEIGGTVNAPEVTLSRSAMLGAAIGTAVLPGIGTGAGATLGGKIGDGLKGLFGGGKK